ncbi:MAG: hypothetical protein HN580_28640 [Deltaproteobacteria bacterium]|nr:hypothetical protein [Deltaproteobacteria bacterium]MBT4267169.1 hypothetical protein [Deltaproteobacteria bacterium]MBT4642069.1 hypothetical protein [Deltaproteobacteria bacterium]MBT6498433.1 hypothetical protein [Deltaproteobacteria bacterium]MBT6614537.1 hypothetical protein [Deltaproteobacteria bacterium]
MELEKQPASLIDIPITPVKPGQKEANVMSGTPKTIRTAWFPSQNRHWHC